MKSFVLVCGLSFMLLSGVFLAGVGCGSSPTTPAAPTVTDTPQFTQTTTPTPSVTNTLTATQTLTVTQTFTQTFTPTQTQTPTITPTITLTLTVTSTPTCPGASGNYSTGTGGSSDNASNTILANRVQFQYRVKVTDLKSGVYASDGGTHSAEAGIYSDVAGAPGTLIEVGNIVAVHAQGLVAETTFTIPSPVFLDPGYYWLAVGAIDTSAVGFNYSAGTAGIGANIAGQSFPSTFPSTYNHNGIVVDITADWTCP